MRGLLEPRHIMLTLALVPLSGSNDRAKYPRAKSRPAPIKIKYSDSRGCLNPLIFLFHNPYDNIKPACQMLSKTHLALRWLPCYLSLASSMIQCHDSHSTKKRSAQDRRQCEERARLQKIWGEAWISSWKGNV